MIAKGDEFIKQSNDKTLSYGEELELIRKAIDYFKQAVEAAPDYDYARYFAGFYLLFYDLGGEKKAIEIALPAAEHGYVDAQYIVGRSYLKLNDYGKKDEYYKNAFKWFDAAAKQRDLSSCYYLGWCYENQLGTKQDFAAAAKNYEIAAKDGEGVPAAMARLGSLYAHGYGVRTDIQQAMKWYDAARKKNHGRPYADFVMRNLIIMDKEKRRTAFEIYQNEINTYSTVGLRLLLMLIFCYSQGIGTERDLQKALELTQRNDALKEIRDLIPKLKSITLDEFEWNLPSKAMFRLQRNAGELYNYDPEMYFEMYFHWNLLRAQKYQDAEGELYVAHCYRDGCGTPIDDAKAIDYYKKVIANSKAGRDADIARRILAECYDIHV